MTTIRLKYGNTNTFFINGLLFDTDMPMTLNAFFRESKSKGLVINDFKYVICSHYHPDHMGLVSELMKLGIRLLIIDNQQQYVHFSDSILTGQFGLSFTPVDETKAVCITADESRDFLKKMGIDGEIITTSSHSDDGVALILDNGECFVGDIQPYQYIDSFEDNVLLKKDWEKILKYNPGIIHFGHNIDEVLLKIEPMV